MIVIINKKRTLPLLFFTIMIIVVVSIFKFHNTKYHPPSTLEQAIKSDIYQVWIPGDWKAVKDNYELQFIKYNKTVGWLNIYRFYPWDEKLGYMMGNHKEIVEDIQLGKEYSYARFIRLLRDKPAPQQNDTLTEEIHICFIVKDYSIAFDLMFFTEYIDQDLIMSIAKTFIQTYGERLIKLTLNARSADYAGSWIKEILLVHDEIETDLPNKIDIVFDRDMDEASLTPLNIFVYDADNGFKRSIFFRQEYNSTTRTLRLSFLSDWYSFGTPGSITVYITSKVRNIKGREMDQTYFLRLI